MLVPITGLQVRLYMLNWRTVWTINLDLSAGFLVNSFAKKANIVPSATRNCRIKCKWIEKNNPALNFARARLLRCYCWVELIKWATIFSLAFFIFNLHPFIFAVNQTASINYSKSSVDWSDNHPRFDLHLEQRVHVSKETVVLRRWEYYKIIWFYQLGW